MKWCLMHDTIYRLVNERGNEARQGRESQRKYAIAQYTNTLKEGYCPAFEK